jgi:hypothetical protein
VVATLIVNVVDSHGHFISLSVFLICLVLVVSVIVVVGDDPLSKMILSLGTFGMPTRRGEGSSAL